MKMDAKTVIDRVNKCKLVAAPSVFSKDGDMQLADNVFLSAEPNSDLVGVKARRVRGSQVVVTLDDDLKRLVADIADGESRSGTIRRMLRFAARHMPRGGR